MAKHVSETQFSRLSDRPDASESCTINEPHHHRDTYAASLNAKPKSWYLLLFLILKMHET